MSDDKLELDVMAKVAAEAYDKAAEAMEKQLVEGGGEGTPVGLLTYREQNKPAPELRRVWIHNGDVYQTRDGRRYVRDESGTIRCVNKIKGHGKKARKMRAAMRQAFGSKLVITDSPFIKGTP